MNLCVKSFLICCVAQLALAAKMLSPVQQHLVSNFLSAKHHPFDLPFKNVTLRAADEEHDSVEAEVARQRAEYTETGQSQRERDLLADMGRLEDKLEGYRRLSPSLHRHLQMQEATAKSLRALEAKSLRIEGMAAALWWDSKMMMCAVIIFGAALCIYVHTRQSIPQQALISFQSQSSSFSKFAAAAPQDASPLDCEYFSLAEKPCDPAGESAEDRWWNQPCKPRTESSLSGLVSPRTVQYQVGSPVSGAPVPGQTAGDIKTSFVVSLSDEAEDEEESDEDIEKKNEWMSRGVSICVDADQIAETLTAKVPRTSSGKRLTGMDQVSVDLLREQHSTGVAPAASAKSEAEVALKKMQQKEAERKKALEGLRVEGAC